MTMANCQDITDKKQPQYKAKTVDNRYFENG